MRPHRAIQWTLASCLSRTGAEVDKEKWQKALAQAGALERKANELKQSAQSAHSARRER